jgi:hypothetical protein
MAKIIISELLPINSENFLTDIDLHNSNSMLMYGGDEYTRSQIFKLGQKAIEFALVSLAISSIVQLVESFIDDNKYD